MDAIQLAGQLGRLDFVSALLATVALLMAFSALPLFYFLRHRAETVAREAARAQFEKLRPDLEAEAIRKVEDIVPRKVEDMLPKLVKDYMDIDRREAEVHRADDIARAQEDDGHDDNR